MLALTSGTAVSCFDMGDNSVELSTVITNIDLGQLDNANEATVKAALKQRNSRVKLEAIKILNIELVENNGTTKIESSNFKIYKGSIDILFSINSEEIIEEINLGNVQLDLELSNSTTKDEIIITLNKATSLILSETDIDIEINNASEGKKG